MTTTTSLPPVNLVRLPDYVHQVIIQNFCEIESGEELKSLIDLFNSCTCFRNKSWKNSILKHVITVLSSKLALAKPDLTYSIGAGGGSPPKFYGKFSSQFTPDHFIEKKIKDSRYKLPLPIDTTEVSEVALQSYLNLQKFELDQEPLKCLNLELELPKLDLEDLVLQEDSPLDILASKIDKVTSAIKSWFNS